MKILVDSSYWRLCSVLLRTVSTLIGLPSWHNKLKQKGLGPILLTGLMWVARDSEKRMSWHKAEKYCHTLKALGYSDWRLGSIDELESLVNLPAYATEHVGSSDTLHWNGDLHVNGGLFLPRATPVFRSSSNLVTSL